MALPSTILTHSLKGILMGTDLQIHFAYLTALLTEKLPKPKSERGQNTLEYVIIAVVVVAIAVALVALLRAKFAKESAGLK